MQNDIEIVDKICVCLLNLYKAFCTFRLSRRGKSHFKYYLKNLARKYLNSFFLYFIITIYKNISSYVNKRSLVHNTFGLIRVV